MISRTDWTEVRTKDTAIIYEANVPTTGGAALIEKAVDLLDVIEVGDTKARVLSIQGTPDDAGEAIFRYGSSVVYFQNGRVRGWLDRHPRLHVRDWAAFMLPSLDTFALGSSRGDVIRAQGEPGAFTASNYTYGSSVVLFENDRVAGWNEGDVRLQRFEMPSLKFFDLDRMAVGTSRGMPEF